MTTCW